MSINHFKIIDANEKEIASNLTDKCEQCYSKTDYKGRIIDCPLYFNKRRNGKIKNNNGVTFNNHKR